MQGSLESDVFCRADLMVGELPDLARRLDDAREDLLGLRAIFRHQPDRGPTFGCLHLKLVLWLKDDHVRDTVNLRRSEHLPDRSAQLPQTLAL